jgi:hypothetical protein
MHIKYLTAVLFTAAAGIVAAQTAVPAAVPLGQQPAPNAQSRIDTREANQDRRINNGVASGQLTQKEAARMEKGQSRVDTMENKALANGSINKREAARIQKAQNKQSKRIYRQKHDKQKSPVAG